MKENIMSDFNSIANPVLLNQVNEYIQLLKVNKSLQNKNQSEIMKLAGSLSQRDAEEITAIVDEEFSEIEGEWEI